MEINEKAQHWLNMADYDLDVSKSLLKSKHYLYVGFMCHLVIEKALKAVIAEVTNEVPPKSHHLIELAERAKINDKMSDEQKLLLLTLNPLNIEARYSEYKEKIAKSLTKQRCATLIKETEELLCWIRQQLSTPSTDTQTK